MKNGRQITAERPSELAAVIDHTYKKVSERNCWRLNKLGHTLLVPMQN